MRKGEEGDSDMGPFFLVDGIITKYVTTTQ